jgi:hypothetical protein
MGRRPTIQDLAVSAGVSVATVDRVLNKRHPVKEGTARRVLEAAERIGFYATGLLRQRLGKPIRAATFGRKRCFGCPSFADAQAPTPSRCFKRQPVILNDPSGIRLREYCATQSEPSPAVISTSCSISPPSMRLFPNWYWRG